MPESSELQYVGGNGSIAIDEATLMSGKYEISGEQLSVRSDHDYERNDAYGFGAEHFARENDRGFFANKKEFFLAIMGYSVGIGSVWRFPIMCSRNGGGAFLVPFFFFLITSGGPLYYLEVCIGQFSGKSAILAFEFCPILKGLGALQVTLSLTVLWYSIHILAWVLYFLYSSFKSTLPWTTCGNPWNTPNCTEIATIWSNADSRHDANFTAYGYINYGLDKFNLTLETSPVQFSSSAYEFWEYNVIGRSRGLEDMGSLQLHLVVCLFLAWFFCVLTVIKGAKTLGKVVYITATVPFVFLTIMFIKGLTLDGSVDGILVFLKPDFSKLLTVQVWLEAAIQVFYSLGPTWGGVVTMASYNKFHQQSFWSSTLCVICTGFTSIYNGIVVFTLLGYMAKASGRTLHEVAQQSGPGLVFVAFPTALSQMPIPQLWSVLFFLMLVAVVFDSLFGELETVTSAVVDMFPRQLIKRRVLVNIITGLCFFITGLPLTLNGGIYIFQLADWYFSQFALLIGSLLECVAVCWIYACGRENFTVENIKKWTYICSKHFVGGKGPTENHPDPIPATYTPAQVQRYSRKRKAPTPRTQPVSKRALFEASEALVMLQDVPPINGQRNETVTTDHNCSNIDENDVIPSVSALVEVTFLMMITQYSAPAYGDGYVYSDAAIAVGIFFGIVPIIAMFVAGMMTVARQRGPLLKRIQHSLSPSSKWFPNDREALAVYRSKPYKYPDSVWQKLLLNIRGN